jgi:hypothetical protein
MKKTVIIADKNGQIGHRLFLFAHYIANSIRYDYKLINPDFNEFRDYFDSAKQNDYGNLAVSTRFSNSVFLNNIITRIFKFIAAVLHRTIPATRWYKLVRIYQTSDQHIDKFIFHDIEKDRLFSRNEKIVFMQGWSFRSPESVVEYKKEIRRHFRLKPFWKLKVDNFVNSCKGEADMLIGVDIRRGDFKNFMNGKYYYSAEEYRSFMEQTIKLFPEKKITFVICSNERIQINDLDNCNVVYGPGHFIEDLYTLAECDYLLGPPSTFSQWASYYGDKPLRIITDAQTPIRNIKEFTIASL